MARRFALSLLAGTFLLHATGLTLAAHLHDCHDEHDAQRCSACQMLVGGASILPAQVEPPALDTPTNEARVLPAEPACLACDDDIPQAPRAPPLA